MPETVYRLNLLGRMRGRKMYHPLFSESAGSASGMDRDYEDIHKEFTTMWKVAYAADIKGKTDADTAAEFIPMLQADRISGIPAAWKERDR